MPQTRPVAHLPGQVDKATLGPFPRSYLAFHTPVRPTVRPSLFITALFLASGLRAADRPVATFTENKGQWPENVLYRTLFPGGALFVEKNAFTFSLVQGGILAHHGHDQQEPYEPMRAHAYRVTFEGASSAKGEGGNKQSYYENFFSGSDASKWGGHCEVFGEVTLHDLYPGIDLRIDGRKGLKYEFIVAAGSDPSVIRMRYEGQEKLALDQGSLVASTTAGVIVEGIPHSWVSLFDGIDNVRSTVPSSYRLQGDIVSFDVEKSTLPLTIDPDLTFASYSGSAANNFGFTATYDNDGNLYGGGIAFGFGYPVTVGVQQGSFAGGTIDIALTKFSADGVSLEWSTYLGGSLSNETPHSLVVNENDELFVLAVTGSSDFPTTPGCFDNSFNGGVDIPLAGGFVNMFGGEGYDFTAGTDIAVVHFAADAASLIGSTFVGGTNNDGLNQSPDLVHNYGDHFRGEIALDAQGDPVVASSTQSADFPTTSGVPQQGFGGGVQDAILFKLNAALTNVMFATYCGGSQDESGYGVQFSSNGEVFLTGGTSSSDLPMAGSPFDNSYGGGNDGYIMRYASNGQSLLSSTYVGTSGRVFPVNGIKPIDVLNAIRARLVERGVRRAA